MTGQKGFTLIEVLISAAIFAVVMVALYASFQSGLFGYTAIDGAITASQEHWQALERFSLDLRNTYAYSSKSTLFKGSGQTIQFLSLVDSYSDKSLARSYNLVEYFANGTTLYRRSRQGRESLNEHSGAEADELAHGITSLTFQYAQSIPPDHHIEWKDSWDYKKEFPAAVKIRLVSEDNPKEPYERTVFIP